MRAAVLMLAEEQYVAYSRLDYVITTGEAAFPKVYSVSNLWKYLQQHPETQNIFNEGQHSLSFLGDKQITIDYTPFININTVCDIAGGLGALLKEILRVYPHIHGILFDQSHVIDRAEDIWKHSIYQNHSTLIRGDFFDPTSLPQVPQDCYILKQVLHQYGDDESIIILRNIKTVMSLTSSRLLIIDRIMPNPNSLSKTSFISSHGAAFVDLMMMSNFFAAYERTLIDWQRIILAAGFDIEQIIQTRSDFAVLETWPQK